MRKNKKPSWEKIQFVKKVRRCKQCGKKISVKNFNRELCVECGYRGEESKEEPVFSTQS